MNKVMLMGFVGNDPAKVSEGLVRLSLATHRRGYTKKDGTVVPDATDWHNLLIATEREAKFTLEYVKKGSLVLVEGELRYSTYTDKGGIERKGTDIVVSSISFPSLGQKRDKSQEGEKNEEHQGATMVVPEQAAEEVPF